MDHLRLDARMAQLYLNGAEVLSAVEGVEQLLMNAAEPAVGHDQHHISL